MNELLVVFVGLAIMMYIFLVLGTARLAILKGLNSVILFVIALTVEMKSPPEIISYNAGTDETEEIR